VNKIIPLVLVVSLSLIIGNQVAFAETNVWGFYGEDLGSKQDAANPGPLSSMNNILNPGSVTIHATGVATYQNVANAMMSPGILSGPTLVAKCFEGIPNPEDTDDDANDDWVFGGQGALPFKCIQNQRNAQDLGLGVKDPAVPAQPLVQPLEVEVGQLVVIDLTKILGNHENFMFRISSNSMGEKSWVAVSNKPPMGILNFPGDFTPLGPNNGFFPGCSRNDPPLPADKCLNNDADISFTPKKYLYYTQTTRDRDNLLQQIKADKIEIVGGHGGITDKTALLLSGSHLTASWMIPLIVSAIGIGVFVVTRK